MTKRELRDVLNTTHSVCDDMCLYDLLECETEEQFEEDKSVTIECLRIEISHIRNLIDALEGLEYSQVHGDAE